MIRPKSPIERYQVSCPRCGHLQSFHFFGDACQYAQRQQEQHRICGDLLLMNVSARPGSQRTFDRFGEVLSVRE